MASVTAGGYVLDVDAPGGTRISSPPAGRETDSPALRDALDQREPKDRPLEAAVGEAEQLTGQAETALDRFNTLAQGPTLHPAALSGEIDGLLDLLARLDRAGRFKDVIRVARVLSRALALSQRWLELVRSLRTALHAARAVGDEDAAGWALHELGTLHLAGGHALEAEHRLREAREIRERLGDSQGLAATDANLQALCRALRQLVNERKLVERRAWARPAILAATAAALLSAGGIAGAVVGGGSNGGNPEVSVKGASATNQSTPTPPLPSRRVPNLRVASIDGVTPTLDRAHRPPWVNCLITYTLENAGGADAESSTSSVAFQDARKRAYATTRPSAPLAAGTKRRETATLSASLRDKTCNGEIVVSVSADSTKVVPESDEGDNAREARVKLATPGGTTGATDGTTGTTGTTGASGPTGTTSPVIIENIIK